MPRKSQKAIRAAQSVVTREEVIRGLKALVEEALEKGNLNAAVSAWEKLGKSLAMFTDVQKTESTFVTMDSSSFRVELRELIANDDLVREYLRAELAAYDEGRSGGSSMGSGGGPAGGETPTPGPLSPAGASGRVSRGWLQ